MYLKDNGMRIVETNRVTECGKISPIKIYSNQINLNIPVVEGWKQLAFRRHINTIIFIHKHYFDTFGIRACVQLTAKRQSSRKEDPNQDSNNSVQFIND